MSTNEFELDDLSDFYTAELGAEIWTYTGVGSVTVIFKQSEFEVFIQQSDLPANPNLFDTIIDTNGKTWYVKEFDEPRYCEYRILVSNVPPLIAQIQQPNFTIEDAGGQDLTWSDSGAPVDVWVDPFDGNNQIFDDKIENITKHNVAMLFTPNIGPNYRLLIGIRVLNIKQILDPKSFNKRLDLACWETQFVNATSGPPLPPLAFIDYGILKRFINIKLVVENNCVMHNRPLIVGQGGSVTVEDGGQYVVISEGL